MTTIYHNPRCSKSRETLQLLEENGVEVQIIRYLDTPPTKSELEQVISFLGIKPLDLVRTQEKEWKENFKDKTLSDDEIIDAMLRFPRLIERPIVVNGKKAAIGRPPKTVLDIL